MSIQTTQPPQRLVVVAGIGALVALLLPALIPSMGHPPGWTLALSMGMHLAVLILAVAIGQQLHQVAPRFQTAGREFIGRLAGAMLVAGGIGYFLMHVANQLLQQH